MKTKLKIDITIKDVCEGFVYNDFRCNAILHSPIKFNGEFVKKTNPVNDIMLELYKFLENQILLFKLDKILF